MSMSMSMSMSMRKSFTKFQSFVLKTASKSKSQPFSSSFSTSIPNLSESYLRKLPNTFATLTQEEACKINLLIPRLCLSNHLTTAIQLATTAVLLTHPAPTPKSLSLSLLLHSLTLQPDIKLSLSLLTRLTSYPYLTPMSTMLIASYLKNGRPKDAFKLYTWMLNPCNSNSMVVDKDAYGILVGGLCASGLLLEGLCVLRDMLRLHLFPGEALRKKVVRSLLREAWVKEAMAFQQLLPCTCNNDVLDLLDHIICQIRQTS